MNQINPIEDPLAILMGQFQSMSLSSIKSSDHHDGNHLTEQEAAMKWDDFVQRVHHANLLRVQLEGQRPLLDPNEFRDMAAQYAFTSIAVQPPWSLVSRSLASTGIDARFETEVWERIHSNSLRQIDDMILLSEIQEAEGKLSPITREDLICRREMAIENRRRYQEEATAHRRQQLERENRLRLLEEELRLMDEKRRLLDEEDRLLEQEWRRQVEEDQLAEREDERKIVERIEGMGL